MIETRKIAIPKEIEKEITFMLYNYQNIDKLIDSRKNELIDNMNVTNKVWLKSINKPAGTLEDVVMSFETDKKILKLKKWKMLINVFYSKLYDNQNPVYYWLIRLKYMEKIKEEVIMERLNYDKEQFKNLDIYLKWKLYCMAVERNLYK